MTLHAPPRGRAALATHEVENQPEPRGALPLWDADAPLRETVARLRPDAADPLAAFGAALGSAEALAEAANAQHDPPRLTAFDRGGRRIDEVAFAPGYHALMRRGAEAGMAAGAWDPRPGLAPGHVGHAGALYLLEQIEPGVTCPLTMTYAAVPALRHGGADPIWAEGCLSARYDPASRPAAEKTGLTLGMAMTEKQGGSDVRANSTVAVPDGEGVRLTGHKWFCSAPMSDAFLTLARGEAGLTCFLVPRWTPDGARNAIQIERLKDKLGNTANASAEIEYHGAWATLVGEPGRGVNAIIEMVHHTRLSTSVAPAALMRRALDEACWWTRARRAFQRTLIDQPLMTGVIADLTLDWLGALLAAFRVADAYEGRTPEDRAFARIAVALTKYWNNKRCPVTVVEAMECLGGMGYVEDTPMPLLYREAPLNGIWEGSGNVVALDVLRSLARAPECAEALIAELRAASGADPRYDAAVEDAADMLARPIAEARGRAVVERLALLLQAAQLIRHAPAAAADAFVASRVAGDWGRTLGTLPEGADAPAIAAIA